MKKQFYYENKDAEICFTEEYFIDKMESEGIKEMTVLKAVPDKIPGIFWCKCECFCGDDSKDTCGKQCKAYEPRNGKSGCCRHYTTKLYIYGEKITINLKEEDETKN